MLKRFKSAKLIFLITLFSSLSHADVTGQSWASCATLVKVW